MVVIGSSLPRKQFVAKPGCVQWHVLPKNQSTFPQEEMLISSYFKLREVDVLEPSLELREKWPDFVESVIAVNVWLWHLTVFIEMKILQQQKKSVVTHGLSLPQWGAADAEIKVPSDENSAE